MKGRAHLWRRFRRNRGAVVGLFVLLAIVLAAVFGPMIYTVDPFDMIGRPAQTPSARFPLGTDVTGATCSPACCTVAGSPC
jgi:peptide/nickel transport system permease protein